MAGEHRISRMYPLNNVNSTNAVSRMNELYDEDHELRCRIRLGVGLLDVWSVMPRLNHRFIYKKRNEAFDRTCWLLRSFYRNTLTFGLLP